MDLGFQLSLDRFRTLQAMSTILNGHYSNEQLFANRKFKRHAVE